MNITRLLTPVALAAAAITATPADAALPTSCDANLGSFSVTATDCVGWFQGSVLSGNPANVAIQTDALAALGLTFTNWSDYEGAKINTNGSGVFDFGTMLSGPTIIGIHFGAGSTGPTSGLRGGGTAFFLFDIGTPVSSITTALGASSSAVLYQMGTVPAVPEPGTWAMMLIGFGAIGFTMRKTRRGSMLPQAA